MPDPSFQSKGSASRFVDGYFPPLPPPQMAVDNETIVQLIRQLEADRAAYLATFEKINETLSQALASSQPSFPEIRPGIVNRPTVSSTGSLIATAVDQTPASPKLAASTSSRRTNPSSRLLDKDGQQKDSIWTAEDSSDSDDDESYFAQETLPSREFTEDDLIEHLMTHDWDKYSKFILQDLLRNLDLLGNGIFHKDRHMHQLDANHEHADIYHVGIDGAPLRYSRGDSDDGPLATWDALRSINVDEARKQAVGRIITMREPPSSLLAALHLTMKEHFDMDSIYRLLINDDTPTKMITKGYLKKDHRRQRSVVFVFKYHTVVGDGRKPLPWQSHDDALSEPKEGHIPLATCSAVVALSLSGRPSHTLRRNSRKTKSIVGHIYDPFAPWHVLSIQAFPDWNSSVDAHNTSHHYVNGPDAFLATVLAEYRDAIKRFKEVHRQIVQLATPPNKSIFDSALRDELLFENDKFSYSRRYFWASQALGVLVNEIKAMVLAYTETFNDDFWSGEHKTLFPGTKDQSSRYSNWRKKLQHTRKLFEKEIAQLHEVLHMFQHQQKEIKGLREWLFSGTSVLESREAVNQAKITVEQGYNIRLLTFVTMFFLPLTFVTSIFGMTNMPPEDSFLPFALTSVGICVPTYFIILVVNNVDQLKRWITNTELFFTKIISCAVPDKAEKMKKNLHRQRERQALQHGHSQRRPMIRKAATHASLEPRLTSELTLEPIRHATHSILGATTRRVSQSLSHHLPGSGYGHRSHGVPSTPLHLPTLPSYSEEKAANDVNDDTTSPLPRQERANTAVTFEEPIYSPSMLRTLDMEGTVFRDMEKTSTLSPISRGTTLVSHPSHGNSVGRGGGVTGSTSSATMVDDLPTPPSPMQSALQQRSLTVPVNQSIFRRWSARLSPMQNSPRTPDSGQMSPTETV
ncbi:uncharacterized protein A1O9_08658 [Exophiala aquamarina CBS 119918]|uniref:Uncharacterized protein n=1 Tax=Exophiala aquamarina CBS 119918 TaxID=1182545 RepID=A0A072P564_9EURO|nr:uncharacterized protein A1O9_08658 [Exophiala aquamarina CBS 119918]KEF55006.1 hypothetical protein A1O9_08658 [Exophiala aquamarina CBS 119918]